MKRPTAKQLKLLRYLATFKESKGYQPSFAEVCQHFGFTSKATVSNYFRRMEASGLIIRMPGSARAVTITQLGKTYLRKARS